MSSNDVKGQICLEDMNIGVGTFVRKTSSGADQTVTKIPWGDRGSAAPTTGEYPKGWVRWNTNPVPGGNMGWVCTTAGTPGTWKEWGIINA